MISETQPVSGPTIRTIWVSFGTRFSGSGGVEFTRFPQQSLADVDLRTSAQSNHCHVDLAMSNYDQFN